MDEVDSLVLQSKDQLYLTPCECVCMSVDVCADTLIYCFIEFAKMFLTSAMHSVCMSFNSPW